MIKVIGRNFINSPIVPGQKASGTNGASTTSVPESTGRNTSPAAILAALRMGTLPLSKTRCVFSITTIASSTTIPSASRNENRVIKFNVNPMVGNTRKAMKLETGTERPTKMAFVAPMKNISTIVTKIKPIMIVLIRSCTVVRVLILWSAVMVTFTPGGKTLSIKSFLISSILSAALIRFWPLRFTILSVITFLESRRAKLSCSLCESITSATSFK